MGSGPLSPDGHHAMLGAADVGYIGLVFPDTGEVIKDGSGSVSLPLLPTSP